MFQVKWIVWSCSEPEKHRRMLHSLFTLLTYIYHSEYIWCWCILQFSWFCCLTSTIYFQLFYFRIWTIKMRKLQQTFQWNNWRGKRLVGIQYLIDDFIHGQYGHICCTANRRILYCSPPPSKRKHLDKRDTIHVTTTEQIASVLYTYLVCLSFGVLLDWILYEVGLDDGAVLEIEIKFLFTFPSCIHTLITKRLFIFLQEKYAKLSLNLVVLSWTWLV